jgi:2-polyprenyl-3-methyl-5-hydroxy-6-metoxy-1,4-benzoquinol methylase
MSEQSDSLREQFGDIDVYLFDQLLRGRIVSGMQVLDAGCGSGRNLIFLMRAGFDVWQWYMRCGECSRQAACSSQG